ncbi:MAG: hypothetical protein K1W21_02765 [Oscillospiraceae bacterium]
MKEKESEKELETADHRIPATAITPRQQTASLMSGIFFLTGKDSGYCYPPTPAVGHLPDLHATIHSASLKGLEAYE